jgi:hypothetical protein
MSIRTPAGGDLRSPPRLNGLKFSSSGAGAGATTEGAPAGGDLLNPPRLNGLKPSSSTGAGRAPGFDGLRLAAEAIPPLTRLSDPSSGRVGVGASLTIRLVAKRAARASEGLSKVNADDRRLIGNFTGDLDLDLDLARSKAAGLFRDMLAIVGEA